MHSQNRPSYLPQLSSNNFSTQSPRKSSFFTCCGFSIDLSQKHSISSLNGDLASRRSTMRKSSTNTNYNNYNNSPRKSRTYSHSPKSSASFDRNLRHQQTVSYKSSQDSSRTTTRRRASAAVHCFQHSPASTVASIANQSVTLNTSLPFANQSLSNDKRHSSIEILPTSISDSPPTSIDVHNSNNNPSNDITDSSVIVQNLSDEQILPAYIVETC